MDVKRKVLIIGNKKSYIKLWDYLSSEFYVLLAEDCNEVEDTIYSEYNSISAVILSLSLAEKEGKDFLKKLKEDVYLSEIPIIAIANNGSDEEELSALNNGISDYIRIPCNGEIFATRLRNVICNYENMVKKDVGSEMDNLTHIYSRYAFYYNLHNMVAENTKLEYSVALIDIYKFKIINDVYGPVAADKILIKIADELSDYVAKYNGICAHNYADQFLMGVPNFDENEFKEVIKKIESNINESLSKNKIILKAGVYKVEDRNMSVITMCARAKYALNNIKEKYNVNVACYDTDLRKDLLFENKITSEMKKALNDNQFKVYFQPKYSINNEKIIGAEALVRWQHPEMGIIEPSVFIPIFEKNGFITELDYFVWEYCCKFIRERIDAGKNIIPISVNVSRIDISNENIVHMIKGLVDKYNIDPEYLHIEITESAYYSNEERLYSILNEFKNIGFKIEIDDFGSGYSSLSVLSEMPADILKLDMRFIQTKKNIEVRNKIIYSVVRLAKWMGMKIIAEGVETKEQFELLREIECDFVQGFYFSKPVPEDVFCEIVDN